MISPTEAEGHREEKQEIKVEFGARFMTTA